MDQEELNALRQVISDELQDMGQVLQCHEEGINDLIAEKVDDRNVMSVIQRRLDSLHRRVSKAERFMSELEQCVERLHKRVAELENQPPTGK